MSDETPIVVFDFDLTLTRWDTADRFFRWLLKRDPWRLALVGMSLPVMGPLFLVAATRRWPIRFAVWVATLGRSVADLEPLVREHADGIFSGVEPVFLDEGLARLQQHLDQGHRVVIATGSLEVLARELLQRAGHGEVALVASTLRPCFGGLVRDRHCFADNKIPMLTERGFAPPWAVAYTDHHCDLPVLRLSRERFLISPKATCVVRIEQALATSSTILAWR
ncbi:MAG: haloacid dehalogenase-like hydrolase [Arenimonas sp.]